MKLERSSHLSPPPQKRTMPDVDDADTRLSSLAAIHSCRCQLTRKPRQKNINASSTGVISGQRPNSTGVNTGYAEINRGGYLAGRKRPYSRVDMLGLRCRFVNFEGNAVNFGGDGVCTGQECSDFPIRPAQPGLGFQRIRA